MHDNPLLDWAHGSEEVESVIPVFVLDTGRGMGEGGHIGPNRMRFLYDSLTDLDDRLRGEYSARLLVLEGRPEEAIPLLAEELRSAEWLLCDYQADPSSSASSGIASSGLPSSTNSLAEYSLRSLSSRSVRESYRNLIRLGPIWPSSPMPRPVSNTKTGITEWISSDSWAQSRRGLSCTLRVLLSQTIAVLMGRTRYQAPKGDIWT